MGIQIKKILDLLARSKSDAALISSVSNIIYLTGYSGFSSFEREAFLLITKGHSYIITDSRYSEAVSGVQGFRLLEINHKNSLDQILKSLSETIKIIGIEADNITLTEGKKFKKHFKLVSIDTKDLRVTKSVDEIEKIAKACSIGDKAFDFILGKLKTGITEKEIALELEMFVKKNDAEFSFPAIVAFGKNSSMPHHKTNNERLRTNNIVLLDFGVRFENYCSDMTRTVFFGKTDHKFKKIYQTVLESQALAMELIQSSIFNLQSSISVSKVDLATRNYIIKKGFPSIPHSLGHGIGIDVHEQPRLSPKSEDILRPGMVFSIEPGVYFPGYGGVRIEDIAVLEKSGLTTKASAKAVPRLLTHSPKNLIEI